METTVSVEIVWGKHWVVLDSFWMLVVWAFRESVGFTEILLLLCINIFSFERSNECESVKWQGCDLCTAVESWARGGINITVYWTGKPERQSVNVHSLYWTGNQERQSADVHSLYWTGNQERQSVDVRSLYWTGNQERQSVMSALFTELEIKRDNQLCPLSLLNWNSRETINGCPLSLLNWKSRETVSGCPLSLLISGCPLSLLNWKSRETISGCPLSLLNWKSRETISWCPLSLLISGCPLSLLNWKSRETISGCPLSLPSDLMTSSWGHI